MKKIKKLFKGIAAIIKNPWLLNLVINDDSLWQKYIVKNHNIKNGLPLLDINEISPNFSETLNHFAVLDGGSLPTDVALLKSLTRKFEDCKYFEIGTWRGESVLNVSENAKECYTLNLSREDMIAIGLSGKYPDLVGHFSKDKDNITHLTGNSLNFDFKGLNKKFDLIFIDGNHTYDFVKNDTAKVFDSLIHDNTIIVWHDYAFSPEKLRPEVFAGILDGTPKEYRKHLYHVSNTMCAVFIRGEFKTSEFEAPITPDKTFKFKIDIN